MIGASVAIEYADASRLRADLEQALDAAVLAGARETTGQVATAQNFFKGYFADANSDKGPITASFKLGEGVLDGEASRPMEMSIGFSFLTNDHTIRVRSQARFNDAAGGPCITVLSNTQQAMTINSGANIRSKNCEIHVHSQKNPAMVLNSGTKLDIKRLCVKGNTIINNAGATPVLETNCAVAPDPYAGKLTEPALPGSCTTQGAKDGAKQTLKPGLHCNVNFNGSPTITFEPGLHMISGHMNIGSGATVIAQGVTFYFVDSNSRIQANGNLHMTATAPTSGVYKGMLMFEKMSYGGSSAPKGDFIFNGSVNEYLEGVIYLPNRKITYNSKTNIKASRISVYADTMIINSAAWEFEGYNQGGGGGDRVVYLSK